MIYAFITTNILVGQNLFAKAYGGDYVDIAYSITQTQDGGFAVAGWTMSFGAGLYDFLVLKLNSDGSLAWAKTFGGISYDQAWSIIRTSDGGIVVAGHITSTGSGGDFLVLKLTSDGSLTWARTFGGTAGDIAYSITQTQDGGFAVAGLTMSFGAGDDDFLVLKLTSDGSLVWARTFGGTAGDRAYSIVQTSDGGYAVAGYTESFSYDKSDFLVLKLNPDGSLVWARTFGGTNYDSAESIVQATDGDFVVAGYTFSFVSGKEDVFIIKMASDGSSIRWTRAIGGTSDEGAYSIIRTTDGGYAVAGNTWSFGVGGSDFLVLKLNPDGSTAWARTFGGSYGDYAYSMIQTSDGGYALTGYATSLSTGSDFIVLKMNQSGNYPDCVQDCSPTNDQFLPGILLPSIGEVCLPNTSSPSLTITDPSLTITDICEPVAVSERDIIIKPGIACSPVPGGALFVSPGEMPLKIYSVDGRLAYSGELMKGENRISLEAGVYLWNAGEYRGKVAVR